MPIGWKIISTKIKHEQILFSDEKYFSVDGVYNDQNDRICAINRSEANKNGGVKNKKKFPAKVMVWLGVCSKCLTSLVILDVGSLDHDKYIKKVLPVAKKCGNKMLENDWTFNKMVQHLIKLIKLNNDALIIYNHLFQKNAGQRISQI